MGIQRSNRHKRTKTGATKGIHRKKRKYALARQPSNTRIGETRVRPLRVLGGNTKQRALRLNSGTFVLASSDLQVNCDIMQVMYHPTNTELMRTNTLTKGAIVKLAVELGDKCNVDELLNVDPVFVEQVKKGNVYGVVLTRPGQEGKADGRILQGDELEFYMARFKKSKAK